MRPFLVSEVKVTSNHLITPRQALPVTHLTSASINPHAPHFIFRVAKEAMEKKFGHVWQSVGATKVPTFAKEKPLGAKGKSRRAGSQISKRRFKSNRQRRRRKRQDVMATLILRNRRVVKCQLMAEYVVLINLDI